MVDVIAHDEPVAPAEVAAVARIREADVETLMFGPFVADLPDNRMRLRVAFGLYCMALLALHELLRPDLALRVAVDAASHAAPGDNRVMLVAWDRNHRPKLGWFEADTAPPPDPEYDLCGPLHRPKLTLPVDRMLRDFAAALALHRERARAGAH
jgi:hypothetical protein